MKTHNYVLGFCLLLTASELYAQLEEVVVTARRVQESIQDTPVAVSALGEDALKAAGISNIQDVRDRLYRKSSFLT